MSETRVGNSFISNLLNSTSRTEILHLLIAWLALALAFSILMFPLDFIPRFPTVFGLIFASSLVTAGTGFLFHELAHKVVAQRYGYWAEFRADPQMLVIAVLSAVVGFLFAAPGAVMIYAKRASDKSTDGGFISDKESALISVAGPASNILMFFVFMAAFIAIGGNPFSPATETAANQTLTEFLLRTTVEFGMFINAFLAAFNMIPAGPLDGKSVYGWNKGFYAGVMGFSVLLVVYCFRVLSMGIGIPGL